MHGTGVEGGRLVRVPRFEDIQQRMSSNHLIAPRCNWSGSGTHQQRWWARSQPQIRYSLNFTKDYLPNCFLNPRFTSLANVHDLSITLDNTPSVFHIHDISWYRFYHLRHPVPSNVLSHSQFFPLWFSFLPIMPSWVRLHVTSMISSSGPISASFGRLLCLLDCHDLVPRPRKTVKACLCHGI